MLPQRNLANEVLQDWRPKQKQVVIGLKNHSLPSSCSAPNETTMHRFLLSRSLAVKTNINWNSNDTEQATRSAFFRSLAGRLIGVH